MAEIGRIHIWIWQISPCNRLAKKRLQSSIDFFLFFQEKSRVLYEFELFFIFLEVLVEFEVFGLLSHLITRPDFFGIFSSAFSIFTEKFVIFLEKT
jgi:hypothetical protein